jgi:hypothetical protein
MGAFLERLASAGRPPLWLEATSYAGRLFTGGAIPWRDPTTFVAWQRKVQALLKSAVVALPLAAVIDDWLAAHADLTSAMATKQRPLFPLKTLLADASLRTHVVELTRNLRASFADVPLALTAPSPRAWLGRAHAQAHGAHEPVQIGNDDADTAAMYMADFLRAFGNGGIDVLLLEETVATQPASREEIECYRPVLNIASHYRWDLGLHWVVGGGIDLEGSGIDFAIAPHALDVRTGVVVRDDFWAGAAAPEVRGGGFYFAEIPEHAQPERVLDRLAVLRG